MEKLIVELIKEIGENPLRKGLIGTPFRFKKSIKFLTKGYKENPEKIITVFESEGYDEIILLKDIEFYSLCEHHLLPFFGKAHIAYLPDKKIIGISKLARILDMYARRLQSQERITTQIAETLQTYLKPKGVAVILEAEHFCLRARGVEKQNSIMVTSKLIGAFKENRDTRNELLKLIKE